MNLEINFFLALLLQRSMGQAQLSLIFEFTAHTRVIAVVLLTHSSALALVVGEVAGWWFALSLVFAICEAAALALAGGHGSMLIKNAVPPATLAFEKGHTTAMQKKLPIPSAFVSL